MVYGVRSRLSRWSFSFSRQSVSYGPLTPGSGLPFPGRLYIDPVLIDASICRSIQESKLSPTGLRSVISSLHQAVRPTDFILQSPFRDSAQAAQKQGVKWTLFRSLNCSTRLSRYQRRLPKYGQSFATPPQQQYAASQSRTDCRPITQNTNPDAISLRGEGPQHRQAAFDSR